MKTRSRPKPAPESSVTSETPKLLVEDTNPPLLFVLPESVSSKAAFVSLAHPRSGSLARYCFCPHTGVFEFTRISTPGSGFKSCLLQPSKPEALERDESGTECPEKPIETMESFKSDHIRNGYVSETAEIYIATPLDPLYLCLPALDPACSEHQSRSAKAHFLSPDDLMESLYDTSKHFREITSNARTRNLLETRIAAVSDSVNAGDEKMYRLNKRKLAVELFKKAERIISAGIPPSIEEKFVTHALETPMMATECKADSEPEPVQDFEPISGGNFLDSVDSQSTDLSLSREESASSISTSITTPDPNEESTTSSQLLRLQGLRTILSYILSTYVSSHLSTALNEIFASPESPVDFKPLDEHLANIEKLKAEAVASRSLGDFTRKRGFDDEAADERAEKKRLKLEEEKRKKAGESRGLRDLKKADVTGMKKMSDFFKKMPAKSK